MIRIPPNLLTAGCIFVAGSFRCGLLGTMFCFIVGDVALGAPGPKWCSACFGLPMV